MNRVLLPHHHPEEAVLLDYAAGSLDPSFELIVATHLSLCPRCRRIVGDIERAAGAAIEHLPPQDIPSGVLDTLLNRLNDEPQIGVEVTPAPLTPPSRLPMPLRDFLAGDLEHLNWHGVGGVEIHPIKKTDTGTRTYLMRIAGGARMPKHTHAGMEMTLVLEGGFSDAMGAYNRGDLSQTDDDHTHSPVADPDGCICLIVTQNRLRMGGVISGMVARWFDV